jgi:asparagine synthase (glutamine-hydrolysing)
MCVIFGLDGVFNKNSLISAIETLKHNKDKSSGIFLLSNEKIVFNNNILIPLFEDKINDLYYFDYFNNIFNIGLAHNSISTSNKIYNENKIDIYNNLDYYYYYFNSNDCNYFYKSFDFSSFSKKDQNHDFVNSQPFVYKNLVLVFNGKIYNLEDIKDFLKYSDDIYHDGEVLIKIIDYFLCKSSTNLLESIKKTINIIDGDYTFAVFDGKNLVICRDSIGVKPLYYGEIKNNYSNRNLKGFASCKKALWKIGINNNDIKTLKPGYILYNWREIAPSSVPWKLNHSYKSKIANMDYDKIKDCLKDLIIDSTYKRVANLDEVGLIFSGGVDSTILAALLKKLSYKTDLKLNLYSVGNENSQDLQFSKKIAKKLELPLKTQIINEKLVKNSLKVTLKAIEEFNIMKIGVGMVLYLATKLAKKDGIKVAFSGQGADELFAGYNRYLSTYEKGGNLAIDESLSYDIENTYHVNLQRDDAVAMANGVELRVPFLDEKLVEFSLAIPLKYKIHSSTDKLRKHILRDLAIDLGVPEYVAMREKKAAQYGSGLDKILRKKVLNDFDHESFMINFMNNSY